ncbi:MAG: DUF3618 domain-containing protein [Kibdelosporangium sp.]
MTDSSGKATPPGADEIRADIERTRQELGDTAEALAHKVDVPARAKEKANEVLDTTKAKAAAAKETVTVKAEQAMHTAQVKAADVSRQAYQTIDKLPEPAAKPARRVLTLLRERPGMFVAGAILVIALVRRVVAGGKKKAA